MEMKNRIIYYDTLRTLAIISIVMDHAVLIGYMLLYGSFVGEWELLPIISKIIRIVIWEFSRWGVPIFLLLTGALILNKDFDSVGKIKLFYKNNLLPLVVANELWGVFHFVIAAILTRLNIPFVYVEGAEINIELKELVYSILMIKRSFYPNMWYLPMIIGTYLFLPYVSNTLNKFWDILKYVLIGLIVIFFVANDLGFIFELIGWEFLTTSVIGMDFSGSVYGVYIIVGWYLTRQDSFLKKISSSILVIALLCAEIIDISLTKANYDRGTISSLFEVNNSIFQLIIVVSIFELMTRVHKQHKLLSHFMLIMSQISFPIYLIHYPVMLIVDYIIKNISIINGAHCTARVLLDFIITMLISTVFAYIIPNKRFVRKYVFHMPMRTSQEVK